MKKTLLVVFSAALALVLLSSGLANTENKLNASSEDSEATQATNSLVVISSESDGSPNSESTTLAVIDDVLVGTNPSPIVPMGAYKMDDPNSCGLEASEAANDGDIIDEIPDNLKPSPLLPIGIYEINGDDFAALWAGETPDYLFAKIDAEEFESVGHLIDLAENAAARLNDAVPGGAGDEINEMIAGFKSEKAAADPEYLEVTAMVGQVINVARPFYNRLHEVDGVVWPDSLNFIGGNGKYPWPDLPENAGDSEKINYYAFAKKGQAKSLFAWELNTVNELDEDDYKNKTHDSSENNNSGNTLWKIANVIAFSNDKISDVQELNKEDSIQQARSAEDSEPKVESIYSTIIGTRGDRGESYHRVPCNGTPFWDYVGKLTTNEIKLIPGESYEVRHCGFCRHSDSTDVNEGYCICSYIDSATKTFRTPKGYKWPSFTYWKWEHHCNVRYLSCGNTYTSGEFNDKVTSLATTSCGGFHLSAFGHLITISGSSFHPWLWDYPEKELKNDEIEFTGRQPRTFKLDYPGEWSDLDISINNSSFQVDKGVQMPGENKTILIKITPLSDGNYKGTLTIKHQHHLKVNSRTVKTIPYTETYNLKHTESGIVSTYPLSESSGPKYRKVALTGRPINDDKPQAEEESDFTPPETFVDALSQNLRHNVNDYIQPIPTSNDLVLAVRRNYNSEVWTMKSGLRPEEREDLPFGQCWNSNIVSYVQFERFVPLNTSKRSEPDYATVVDENGQQFRFVMVAIGNSMRFFPMPNDRSDAQAFLNTLAFDANGDLVFKKRFGTTLTYKNASLAKRIANDRIGENKSGSTDYSWYRLYEVADRFGNKIRYEYVADAKKKLVPNKIWNVLPTGVTNVALQIQQNTSSGFVEKITCPMGLELNYSYDANGRLKTVRKGGGGASRTLSPTSTFPEARKTCGMRSMVKQRTIIATRMST